MRSAAILTTVLLTALALPGSLRAQTADPASPRPTSPAADAPLSADRVQRFGALCLETKRAQAGKPGSMQAMKEVDLDALARKHGFSGQEEAMEIAMRIAMTEMYASDPAAAEEMMAGPMDPEMKAVLARALKDAPAVAANADALKACKAG